MNGYLYIFTRDVTARNGTLCQTVGIFARDQHGARDVLAKHLEAIGTAGPKGLVPATAEPAFRSQEVDLNEPKVILSFVTS